MIRSKNVKGLDIIPPKKSAFTKETPPEFPKMDTLLIASGRRGGGKSVAVSNYVRNLLEKGLLDRVLLITPTYYSNKEIWTPLDIDPNDDVFEPEIDVLKTIIEIVEQDKKEWEEYEELMRKYKEFKMLMKSDKPIHQIDPMKLIGFMELGFLNGESGEITEPEWKYKHKRPPRYFLIIDDCMGTDLLKPRGRLTQFIIKHRHIADGLGISVAMLVQSYCAIGGLSRAIRENTTLLLLFKNTQEEQIKKIYSEVGDKESFEEFLKLFEYATSKPFGFLVIDFSPKSPELKFRSGWNEIITLDSIKNDEQARVEQKAQL
jgi:hypothetical protein